MKDPKSLTYRFVLPIILVYHSEVLAFLKIGSSVTSTACRLFSNKTFISYFQLVRIIFNIYCSANILLTTSVIFYYNPEFLNPERIVLNNTFHSPCLPVSSFTVSIHFPFLKTSHHV